MRRMIFMAPATCHMCVHLTRGWDSSSTRSRSYKEVSIITVTPPIDKRKVKIIKVIIIIKKDMAP